MALISLRIPDDVAARFSALAATEGGKSALLRRLIGDALGAPGLRAGPMPIGRPHKVTVRFRESAAWLGPAGSWRSYARGWGPRFSILQTSTQRFGPL
jgi:hypothetical protein